MGCGALLLPALPPNCCALAVGWRNFAAGAVARLARFVCPGCGCGIAAGQRGRAAVASAPRLLALVRFWHHAYATAGFLRLGAFFGGESFVSL